MDQNERGLGGNHKQYVHLNFDTQHTLPEHDVPDGVVDEVNSRLTGVNHETVGKFHGLCTGSAKLSGDNDFTALGTGLHNETKDTITRPGNVQRPKYSRSNADTTCEQRDR
jgi:hypothetical protein